MEGSKVPVECVDDNNFWQQSDMCVTCMAWGEMKKAIDRVRSLLLYKTSLRDRIFTERRCNNE